jgi:hypothetical protein
LRGQVVGDEPASEHGGIAVRALLGVDQMGVVPVAPADRTGLFAAAKITG